MKAVITAVLFALFVPGVVGWFPPHASRMTTLAVHSILFAIVYYLVFVERMGNYGDICPNGYVDGINQKGEKDCVPAGTRTYENQKLTN